MRWGGGEKAESRPPFRAPDGTPSSATREPAGLGRGTWADGTPGGTPLVLGVRKARSVAREGFRQRPLGPPRVSGATKK